MTMTGDWKKVSNCYPRQLLEHPSTKCNVGGGEGGNLPGFKTGFVQGIVWQMFVTTDGMTGDIPGLHYFYSSKIFGLDVGIPEEEKAALWVYQGGDATFFV